MVAICSGPSSGCAGFALVVHGVGMRAWFCQVITRLNSEEVDGDGLRAYGVVGVEKGVECLLSGEMRLDAILQLTILVASAGLLASVLELLQLLRAALPTAASQTGWLLLVVDLFC